MDGVSHATRRPQRRRKTSVAGLTKLVLIKSRATRGKQHVKRLQEQAKHHEKCGYDTFTLSSVDAVLNSIIDLCEEESIPNDER